MDAVSTVKFTSEDNGPSTESMAQILETQGLLISAQAATRLRTLTAQRDRLRSAIERLRTNARLSLSRKPVRDWDETFAEVDAALASLEQP